MIKQNIEAELSYAYLHAIAAKAGMSCKPGDRHDDGEGVDAEVNYRGVTGHPYLTQIQLNIQLKATTKKQNLKNDTFSYYFMGVSRYYKLSINDSKIYKILVVLFLPENPDSWLYCTEDELVLKNAAYWVCLYGADKSDNDSGQTVYIPKVNLLTPDGLKDLAIMAVNDGVPKYIKP